MVNRRLGDQEIRSCFFTYRSGRTNRFSPARRLVTLKFMSSPTGQLVSFRYVITCASNKTFAEDRIESGAVGFRYDLIAFICFPGVRCGAARRRS